MNEISDLIKETLDSSPILSIWGHNKKNAICEQERRLSPDAKSAGAFLDFTASSAVFVIISNT